MKILYITTVGITMRFFKDYIQKLLQEGHTIELACNENEYPVDEWYGQMKVPIHPLSCSRSPFSTGNAKAIRQIKQLVTEHQYDIVHCHTPIAAACTRLACRKVRKSGVKVIYTAHGFHFYKGAPFLNWVLFYPVEKLCARWTDLLITINQEDFARAERSFRAKQTAYVPGVGIHTATFSNTQVDRAQKCDKWQIPPDAFLLCSVGELNENKNHKTAIEAIASLADPNIHYVIAGEGDLKASLEKLAQNLGVASRIHFLGFRRDLSEWYRVADAYIHPSHREGLPVSMMEAMAAGLPCIASNIRGNADLIVGGQGGYLCNPTQTNDFATAITKLLDNASKREAMGRFNAKQAEQYDVQVVNDRLMVLYRQVLERIEKA